MSTPKASFTNHCLLKAEMSPKVNIAMSTEELHEDNSCGVSLENNLFSISYFSVIGEKAAEGNWHLKLIPRRK